MSEFSDYFKQLVLEHPDVASRYKQKIECINNIDPFSLDPTNLSVNAANFPPVEMIDIVSYLVCTTSFYTEQQMKAVKSLNAYKYFKAGFVQNCGAAKINQYFVIVGTVKHSQRMTDADAPLKAWIISNEDGGIESAHCTCMAGAGEACSHIGALLYAVEYIYVCQTSTSCTDIRALWKVPTMQDIRAERIGAINFGRIYAFNTANNVEVPALTGDEIKAIVKNLSKVNSPSVLERVLEPFASNFPQEEILQNVYKTLYSVDYECFSQQELIQFVDKNININITLEDCKEILEKTKAQTNSQDWWTQRSGRITASKLKQVCRTSVLKPSLSLIKQICYPVKFKFKTKSTEWGIRHEDDALDEYYNEQISTHEDFRIEKVGLFIRPELPQFAASPDALAHCKCCGTVSVEIKCPYTLKNVSIDDFMNQKTKFLIKSQSDDIILDTSHMYYYQIQQQMALTETKFNDFVVWSPTELFIQRIEFNEAFWYEHQQKASQFHRNVILPELLGKVYTRSTPIPVWCICEEPDDGRAMIACANDRCSIEWFHLLACVGLDDVPNEQFICNDCGKTN